MGRGSNGVIGVNISRPPCPGNVRCGDKEFDLESVREGTTSLPVCDGLVLLAPGLEVTVQLGEFDFVIELMDRAPLSLRHFWDSDTARFARSLLVSTICTAGIVAWAYSQTDPQALRSRTHVDRLTDRVAELQLEWPLAQTEATASYLPCCVGTEPPCPFQFYRRGLSTDELPRCVGVEHICVECDACRLVALPPIPAQPTVRDWPTLQVSGPLPELAVRDVLRGQREAISRCLALGNGLGAGNAVVVVRMLVGPDGRVVVSLLVGQEGEPESAASCLMQAVVDWRFPPSPTGKPTVVEAAVSAQQF